MQVQQQHGQRAGQQGGHDAFHAKQVVERHRDEQGGHRTDGRGRRQGLHLPHGLQNGQFGARNGQHGHQWREQHHGYRVRRVVHQAPAQKWRKEQTSHETQQRSQHAPAPHHAHLFPQTGLVACLVELRQPAYGRQRQAQCGAVAQQVHRLVVHVYQSQSLAAQKYGHKLVAHHR